MVQIVSGGNLQNLTVPQQLKAPHPIVVKLLGIVMLVRERQP